MNLRKLTKTERPEVLSVLSHRSLQTGSPYGLFREICFRIAKGPRPLAIRKQTQNNPYGEPVSCLSPAPWLFESKHRNNPYGEPVCRLSPPEYSGLNLWKWSILPGRIGPSGSTQISLMEGVRKKESKR